MLNDPQGISLETPSLGLGIVQQVHGDGRLVVMMQEQSSVVTCSVLHPIGGFAKSPAAGDAVLVWIAAGGRQGVILGALEPPTVEESTQLPSELVIEASESLTLRVGDGSITIRADGKILIKGKDLVSQAKNTNRIKGGAVAIN